MGSVVGGWRIGLGVVAAVVVVFFNAAWIVADLGFPHSPTAVLETDHYRYIEMAKGVGGSDRPELVREPPFCYRVLVPGLVRGLTRLGVDLHLAFYALTAACLIGFLVALYAILATWGFAVRERLIGVALAGMLPGAIRWYLYQYWMTDPLALLLVAVAILSIRMGWTRGLFALAILGVAARESFVLVVPYYFVYLLRTTRVRAAMTRGFGLAAVVLTTLALIHYYVEAPTGAPWSVLIRDVANWRWQNLLANQLYFATIGSFGVLGVLLVATPIRSWLHGVRHYEDWLVVIGVYASLLLARNTDRLLVYALPVVLPVAIGNLQHVLCRCRRWGSAVLAMTVLAQFAFFVETKTTGIAVISIRQPRNDFVIAVMAALLVLLVAVPRLQRRWVARSEGPQQRQPQREVE